MSLRPESAEDVPAQEGIPGAPRPKALAVGWPAGMGDLLAASLDLARAEPDEAAAALGAHAPDAVLLDGTLPLETLRALVAALPAPGEAGRPAVLIVVPPGQRALLEGLLRDHADELVSGSSGEDEILARVRAALRTRGFLAELHRKNVELTALYARLEGLARRMADELRLASNVQRGLTPPPVQHARLDMAREFLPFREIGGDYYDALPLGPDRVALAIGDVMGKGVPAALLAANLKACLRGQLQGGDAAVHEVVARVNRLFWEVSPKGLFASLFFGVFDLRHGLFEYVNAGHDHPFLVRSPGDVQQLDQGGTVLGLLEDSRYEAGRVRVQRDDVLVFYSDGITDRVNCDGEAYGLERLKEAARRIRGDAARIALYTLLGEVQGWAGGSPAEDDMTLVVAKIR